MKTIGLIGGMSWQSTALYYRHLNEEINRRLGGLHSAKIAMFSVDMQEIKDLQHSGRWEEAGERLAGAARALEAAGADFVVLCTNTMHRVAPAIEDAVSIPLLHIADPTAHEIKRAGIRRIGLLGTRFTMEQEFYRGRLQSVHGIDVVVPEENDREIIHRVIFEELCLGTVRAASRNAYQEIIRKLVERGAQGIILGCTEITLLISPQDSPVPAFDTTAIHASSAVDHALGEVPAWS